MAKVSKRNIRRSFEGCRQTFEGYKLTFVYALVCMYYVLLMYSTAHVQHVY